MSGDRTPADLGSRLRQARESRGLSLRQVATSTKISVGVLDSLERNDLARLPSGVFSRAFVRAFAVEVGLDPDVAIQQFVHQASRGPVAVARQVVDRIEDQDSFESNRQIASTFVRLTALSIPIGALVIYLAIVGRQTVSVERVTRGAAVAQSDRGGSSSDLDVDPAGQIRSVVVTSEQARQVIVSVVTNRRCRISLVVDGRRVLDGVVQPGERRAFEVRQDLVLTADDAAAISMTLNGEEARPLGGQGQSVTVRFNPGTFRDYLPTQ